MILVRHGQSEFNVVYNVTRIDPGVVDPGLTELGRAQAREAAEALEGHRLARLVSSPYRRALETAAIIAGRLDLPVSVDVAVRERAHFVCDVGTPRSILAQTWPDLDLSHIEERWWPEAESEEELAARCAEFRAGIPATADWERVAIVTHWAFIRGLTGLRVANGTVLKLDARGGAAVVHPRDP